MSPKSKCFHQFSKFKCHYLQIYADKMHYSTSTLVTKQLRYCKKQKSSKISFTDCTFHPPNRFLEIDEKVGRKELKILCSHSPFLLTLLTSKTNNQQLFREKFHIFRVVPNVWEIVMAIGEDSDNPQVTCGISNQQQQQQYQNQQ